MEEGGYYVGDEVSRSMEEVVMLHEMMWVEEWKEIVTLWEMRWVEQ